MTIATLFRLDLLVMDFRLPGTDGAALLRQMRAYPHLRRTPACVISALDETAISARLASEGVGASVFEKPLHAESFCRSVAGTAS